MSQILPPSALIIMRYGALRGRYGDRILIAVFHDPSRTEGSRFSRQEQPPPLTAAHRAVDLMEA